jgi:hypothetical protein
MDRTRNLPPELKLKIQAVRGVNFAVFWALVALGGAGVSESEIVEISGVSAKAVRRSLRLLAGAALVTRTHRYAGWTLIGGIQAVLTGGAVESTVPALTASGPLIDSSSVLIDPVVVEGERSLRPLPGPEGAPVTPPDPEKIAALKGSGIGDPLRTELVTDSAVSADWIRRHVAQARRDQVSTRILAHRLKVRDELPDPEADRLAHFRAMVAELEEDPPDVI